jgi:hypothetical protein
MCGKSVLSLVYEVKREQLLGFRLSCKFKLVRSPVPTSHSPMEMPTVPDGGIYDLTALQK